jgi:hypothetical protein
VATGVLELQEEIVRTLAGCAVYEVRAALLKELGRACGYGKPMPGAAQLPAGATLKHAQYCGCGVVCVWQV